MPGGAPHVPAALGLRLAAPGMAGATRSRGLHRKALIPRALRDSPCDHRARSEEHTSELQSRGHLVCRLLLEKKKIDTRYTRCGNLYAEANNTARHDARDAF